MPRPSKKFVLSSVIILLHMVGVIGTLIPATRDLILPLTPIHLILCALLVMAAHQGGTGKLLPTLLVCFAIGYGMEVFGVWTHFPFGSYTYGEVLGWKVLKVPLVIGVNWALLTYCFFHATDWLSRWPWWRVTVASLGMVTLDVLIEPVAMHLGYWQWEGGIIPLQNYLSWFLVSFALQALMLRHQQLPANPVAKILVVCQTIFFLLIIYFNSLNTF